VSVLSFVERLFGEHDTLITGALLGDKASSLFVVSLADADCTTESACFSSAEDLSSGLALELSFDCSLQLSLLLSRVSFLFKRCLRFLSRQRSRCLCLSSSVICDCRNLRLILILSASRCLCSWYLSGNCLNFDLYFNPLLLFLGSSSENFKGVSSTCNGVESNLLETKEQELFDVHLVI
jgi:hypothetical protein